MNSETGRFKLCRRWVGDALAAALACLGWVGLMGFGLAGCATLDREEDLSVNLVNVRLIGSTVWETTAVFTLRVENESPEGMRLTGGVHKFHVDGEFVGKGLSNESLEIPGLSSATQDITVHLRNLSVARRVKPIVERQRFEYRVDSVLHWARSGRSGRTHLDNVGQLDLRDFQPSPKQTVSP